MAPKPDNTIPDPTSSSNSSDSSLPTAAIPPQPLPTLNTIPGFEGPKLKDYLPFMKPKTFGKDRDKNKRSTAINPGLVPGSVPDLPGSAPQPQVIQHHMCFYCGINILVPLVLKQECSTALSQNTITQIHN